MRFFNILFVSCLILTTIVATSAIASVKRDLSLENGEWYSTKASVMKARSVGSAKYYPSSGFVRRDKNENDREDRNEKDKKHKHRNKFINSQMTFYEGSALKNSACYGRDGLRAYDANENDMIAATFMNQLEMCFKCIEVRNPANDKSSIVVKIIDKCADCPPESDNIDLTPTAFKKLANLDLGRVEIEWRPLKNCPSKGRWPKFED
ncbi:14537_t:CDS:1 [Funneliformis geosporum]|uniref:12691_t:CDS:1 n=1 Tax=Funneliformis geosporum TaxID=1117311 RepID=A0A9W4SBQ0_9GLOM|nr:12691_t:CDS:1 [Funneliformis geosporum]CAI2165116.1 14537_t:CDS:1 [Funneliformis geosporum]